MAENKIEEEAKRIAKEKLGELNADDLSNLSVQDVADKYNEYKEEAENNIVDELVNGPEEPETTYKWIDQIRNFDNDYEEVGTKEISDEWIKKGEKVDISIYRKKDAKAVDPYVILNDELKYYNGDLWQESQNRVLGMDSNTIENIEKKSNKNKELDDMFNENKTNENNTKVK